MIENSKENVIEMENYPFIFDENLGLKGFEKLFQKKIEDCLKRNSTKEQCWWEILPTESIFWRLSEIYAGKKVEILAELVEYYEELIDQVHDVLGIEV